MLNKETGEHEPQPIRPDLIQYNPDQIFIDSITPSVNPLKKTEKKAEKKVEQKIDVKDTFNYEQK